MVSIASPKEVSGATRMRRTARKSMNPALRRTTIPIDSPDDSSSITTVNTSSQETKTLVSTIKPDIVSGDLDTKSALKNDTVANDTLQSNSNDLSRTKLCSSTGTESNHCDTATSTVRTVVTADKTIKLVLHSPKPETKLTTASPVPCSTSLVNTVHEKIPPIIIKTVVDDLSRKVIQKEEIDKASKDQTTSNNLKREATEVDDENRSPSKKIKLDDEATVTSLTIDAPGKSNPSLPEAKNQEDDKSSASLSNGDSNIKVSPTEVQNLSSTESDNGSVNSIKTSERSEEDVDQSPSSDSDSLKEVVEKEEVDSAKFEKTEEESEDMTMTHDITSEMKNPNKISETNRIDDKLDANTETASAVTENAAAITTSDEKVKNEIKADPGDDDEKMQCTSETDTNRCNILVENFLKSKECQEKIKEIITPFIEREKKLQRELNKQKSDFAKMKDRCEKSELNFRSWITFANQLQPRIKKCYQFWREWKRPDKDMSTQTTAPYPQLPTNNTLPSNNRFINATAHSRNTTPTPDLPSNSRPSSAQGLKNPIIPNPATTNVLHQSAKPTASFSPTPKPVVGTSAPSILGNPPQKGILGAPPQNKLLNNNPIKSPTKSSPTRIMKPKQNDQSSMVIDLTDDSDTSRSDQNSSTNGQNGRKKVILNAKSPHVNSPRQTMNHVQKHNQMMSGVNLAQQQAKLAMQQAKIQNTVNPNLISNIRNGVQHPGQPPVRFNHRAPNATFRGSTTSVSSANHAPRMSSTSNFQLQSGPKPRQHISYQNGRNNWSAMQANKVVPPPLPPIPASNKTVPAPPAALPIPPKFLLSIKRFKGCVQLSWKTDKAIDTYAEIRAYELFACQPNINSSQKNCGWKRIDSINAMALPMACTLTELLSTSIYFFTVRGRDLYGRFGPCSTPCSNSEI